MVAVATGPDEEAGLHRGLEVLRDGHLVVAVLVPPPERRDLPPPPSPPLLRVCVVV